MSLGDNYINHKKPWENLDSKKDIIINLVIFLKIIAELIYPFLPGTSEKILKSIDESGDVIKITKPENLFPRIK